MQIDKFLNSSPIFHTYLLFEKIFSPFQKELKQEGLTFIQSMILTAIFFEEKQVTPTSLANCLNTSSSNISHALKHLLRKNWILKNKDKEDSRKVLLKLTTQGNKVVLKLIQIYNDTQNIFEEDFGEKAVLTWNKKSRAFIEVYRKNQ